MDCTSETVCFDGRGACDETSARCVCAWPFVQQSDFAKDSACLVDAHIALILHNLGAAAWIATLLGALAGIRLVRRRDLRDEAAEKRILLCIGLSASANAVYHLLSVTSDPFGWRSVGNDYATTVAYSMGISSTWAILLYKPVISRSGLSSSVFTYTGKARQAYKIMSPWLIVCTTVASFLPLLLFATGLSEDLIISAVYFIVACVALILLLCVSYAVWRVHVNINQALRAANRELTPTQRERLVQYRRRTTNILLFSMLWTLGSIGTFFAFGASPSLAKSNSWVLLPIMCILNGLWSLRHVVNQLRSTVYLWRREWHTSSNYDDGRNGSTGEDDVPNQGSPPLPSGSTHAGHGTGVSPFASRFRRRLRGVRRKPLELMTAVAERTAEGTVLFTHVDGLFEPSESGQQLKRLSSSNNSVEFSPRLSTKDE